ncbi:anhydro-N-acetylmuramic acid kinase [Streptomyces sp. NPDC001816]
MRVIGLMSGTSYDAVDAAAAHLRLDGDTLALKPLGTRPSTTPRHARRAL